MVGQELHWGNQDVCMACCMEFGHDIGKVRFEPFLRRMTRALVAEHPTILWKTGTFSNDGSCLLQMVDVVRFLLYNALWHAVGRQEYRNTFAYRGWKTIKCLLHALDKSLQEVGLEVPVSRDLEFKFLTVQVGNSVLQGAHVAAHDNR